MKPCYLFSFSAKTHQALKDRLNDLTQWLCEPANQDLSLPLISYTLNAGRSHFEKRAALVASTMDELKEGLTQLVAGKPFPHAFFSQDRKIKKQDSGITTKVLKQIMFDLNSPELSVDEYRDNMRTLADFYVQGYEIDWNILHSDDTGQRVELPTYPFARESYWAGAVDKQDRSEKCCHPLLDTHEGSSFTKLLHGREFFFARPSSAWCWGIAWSGLFGNGLCVR